MRILQMGLSSVRGGVESCILNFARELSKKNIIHGVGLGRDCDMNLMKQCSQIGRGINVHAKDPTTLRREVSKITQRILIPSLFNCQLKWNIEGEMYPKEISIFGGVMTCYLKVNDEEQNKLLDYKSAGINRVSMGLQVADNGILKKKGADGYDEK